MTYRVAGIGEVLWDRFSDGDRLGGASANFAFHAGQLGAHARIVSRLGRDADGDRLASLLEQRGLSGEYLQWDDTHPTGIVRVKLDHGQPSYLIESPAAWDHLELIARLRAFAGELDALCFGTLAQRHAVSRRSIQEFVLLCPEKTLRLFDLNLRQSFFTREQLEFGLSHATALKLNDEELARLPGLLGWSTPPEDTIHAIFQKYPPQWIAVTRGADGCEIHTRERMVRSRPPTITCVDAVGAGDAFSAALVIGLLANEPLEEVGAQANRIGAYVASQAGAMPRLPGEYRQR